VTLVVRRFVSDNFITDFDVRIGDDLKREAIQKIYGFTGFIVCTGELDHLLLVRERMHFFLITVWKFSWAYLLYSENI
jgi:hypothetical protein